MTDAMYSRNGVGVERCTNPSTWNSFIETNDGPVYNHWGWSAAIGNYGLDRWNLVATEEGTDRPLAALPLVHIESRIFGSQLVSPAFAERGSVVLGTESPERAREVLLTSTKQLADDLDVDFVSLRGADSGPTSEFVSQKRYVTFQVSTDRDPGSVWSNIKDSRQRQIRQAKDNEVLEFRVGDSLRDLRSYYRLYLRSMRGHGSPPHSFAFFRTLWDRLFEEGNFRLSLVEKDEKLINGMIDLALGSTVYQWGVVTDYDHRDLNAGSFLVWKSLEWAAEHGYDTYEFGRTREGSGVYMFKKSFGGSKRWYEDLDYLRDDSFEPPDPADNRYEPLIKIWRRLPVRATHMLGPQIRKRIGI